MLDGNGEEVDDVLSWCNFRCNKGAWQYYRGDKDQVNQVH